MHLAIQYHMGPAVAVFMTQRRSVYHVSGNPNAHVICCVQPGLLRLVCVVGVQTVVMSQEAALHVVLSGAIAEMTQLVAHVRVPLGLPPSHPIPLTTPDTQAKLQLM